MFRDHKWALALLTAIDLSLFLDLFGWQIFFLKEKHCKFIQYFLIKFKITYFLLDFFDLIFMSIFSYAEKFSFNDISIITCLILKYTNKSFKIRRTR